MPRRACPRLWNLDSDADCEAEELTEFDGQACPEGFVLTDDELACIPFFEVDCADLAIPVLGEGCKTIGRKYLYYPMLGTERRQCEIGNYGVAFILWFWPPCAAGDVAALPLSPSMTLSASWIR
jgi:hypothetical protein